MNTNDNISIGELAARSGVPVKTIRFYSDEGLLPPADRTESGYRLYGADAAARLDLIRTLREAGVGLTDIRRVVDRDLDLSGVLRLQLGAVEAQAAALQRVAAALRAALRTDADAGALGRLYEVSRLSGEERLAMVSGFLDDVLAPVPEDDGGFRARMRAGSVPDLPPDPTPVQLDAWIELAQLLADAGFRDSLKRMGEQSWGDPEAAAEAQRVGTAFAAATPQAVEAVKTGVPADGPEGAKVADELVAAMGGAESAEQRETVRRRFAEHDRRAERYWELVATLRGEPEMAQQVAASGWLAEAIRARLAPAPAVG